MITGELITIARPYASAAFELALANKTLAEWEAMLQSGAFLAQQELVSLLLARPTVTAAQASDVFCDILEKVLDPEKKNFIRLLAENKRLAVLPAIAALFAEYRAEHERTVTVQVTSAIALDDATKQQLTKALTERLKRHVTLQCDTDNSLLGGAVLRAGDMVIDGSIRGKLNRLLESI